MVLAPFTAFLRSARLVEVELGQSSRQRAPDFRESLADQRLQRCVAATDSDFSLTQVQVQLGCQRCRLLWTDLPLCFYQSTRA